MNANWLQMLTQLIEDYQDDNSAEAREALKRWNHERDQLRYVKHHSFILFIYLFFSLYCISEMPQNAFSINSLAVFFARTTIPRTSQGVCFAFPIFTRATLPTYWITP